MINPAASQWTISGRGSQKDIYTYICSLESKSPDEEGWTSEHTLSLDFPVEVSESQLKTMLTLMGWLKNFVLVGYYEIDEMEF